MTVPRMAWRNVWRNRRRSGVTIAAMTLALLVMVLYTGLLEGYMVGMERSITDLEMGDVQIFAPGYRDRPSLFRTIDDPGAMLRELDAAGFESSARLLAAALAAGEQSSAGAILRGVDVERDATVSKVGESVWQGEWLSPSDPEGVVLGRSLARTLAAKVGSEIVLLTQAADGSMANDLYRVRGVLETIGDATDRAGVFLTEAAFRELLVLPEGVHQIIVRRPEDVTLAAAGDRVRAIAAQHPLAGAGAGDERALDVATWHQLLPVMADLMQSQKSAMVIISLVVYVAIAMVILNAMLMAVFERIRELGVLKAIGFGPGRVLRLILFESGFMTLVAIVIAGALSVPGLWYLSTHGIDLSALTSITVSGIAVDPVWRAEVTPEILRVPLGTFLLIVGLAALYPALRAAFLSPVDAIRHR